MHHEPGLDALEILALLHAFEAQLLQLAAEGGVGDGNVGVHLDDVAVILLGQGLGTLHQLSQSLGVLQIAHGTPADVEHGHGEHGHLADQHADGALDAAVVTTDSHGLKAPCGFLLAPQMALAEMALGMGLDKCLVFFTGGFCNQFVHIYFSISVVVIVSYHTSYHIRGEMATADTAQQVRGEKSPSVDFWMENAYTIIE